MTERPIAQLTFSSHLCRGLSSKISQVKLSKDVHRAKIKIKINVTASYGSNKEDVLIEKEVSLAGPGDITSPPIAANAVVRTDPSNWTTDFEPSLFPLVEFYDEDFPWRFTPLAAENNRLQPWICLLVLTEGEFEYHSATPEKFAFIDIEPDTALPKISQSWAWAHVHINLDLEPTAGEKSDQNDVDLSKLIKQNPDLAVSRLLCPRKLKSKTAYRAFVVPTFETSRKAGLGEEISSDSDGSTPAWEDVRNDKLSLPVYYEWYFRTGERGDFEYLVRLIEPRKLDKKVGIRDMDVHEPGDNIPGITEPPVLGLEGALKTKETQSTEWINTNSFKQELANLINLSQELQEPGNETKDPIITPPLYGRWHAAVKKLELKRNSWIEELNLDPRNRVAAGLGTAVIQKNQEKYMKSAWEQVKSIDEVNRKLAYTQLAREASSALYEKNIKSLPMDQLLSLTAPVQARILENDATVAQKIADSRLPTAAVDSAFRRIIRARGAIANRLYPGGAGNSRKILSRLNDGEVEAAPPKTAPENQISINDISDQFFPPWLPNFLRRYLHYSHWLVIIITILLMLLVLYRKFFGNESILLNDFFPNNPVAIIIDLYYCLLIVIGIRPYTGSFTDRFTCLESIVKDPGFLLLLAVIVGIYVLYKIVKYSKDIYEAADKQIEYWKAGNTIREENFSLGMIENNPGQPNFAITNPGDPTPPPGNGPDSDEAKNFRQAASDLLESFELEPSQLPENPPLNFIAAQQAVFISLDPNNAIQKRVEKSVKLAEKPIIITKSVWGKLQFMIVPKSALARLEKLVEVKFINQEKFERALGTVIGKELQNYKERYIATILDCIKNEYSPKQIDFLAPIMAAPDFPEPMYEALRDFSRELLIPNLNLIPQNTMARLQVNSVFIESYMAGLNHEMGRELLWREYPTDQRGSYFRQFWDVRDTIRTDQDLPEEVLAERQRDITPIHSWSLDSKLGTHSYRDFSKSFTVLALRADVLKKYPNAVIFARKAVWDENKEERTFGEETKYPLFRAKIEPDITFFGFDLTESELKGSADDPGWFFDIKERAGESRFGLNAADGPAASQVINKWEELSWGNLVLSKDDFDIMNYIDFSIHKVVNNSQTEFIWGSDAADTACITYQDPVLLGVHASELLT